MEKPRVVEKPLVLVPAPAMVGEALILSMSCHLPRCRCLINVLCSIRLHSQLGPQAWHLTSPLGRSAQVLRELGPVTTPGCTLQLLYYDGWLDCETPNTYLGPWGDPVTLSSGGRMLGSTDVEMDGMFDFCMLGVPSTAGSHLAPLAVWTI